MDVYSGLDGWGSISGGHLDNQTLKDVVNTFFTYNTK